MKIENPWEAWTRRTPPLEGSSHRPPGNHEKDWDNKDQKLQQNSLSQSTILGDANSSHRWKGMKLKNGRDSTLSLLENKKLHDLREKQQTQMTLEHKNSPTVARGKEKKSPLSY